MEIEEPLLQNNKDPKWHQVFLLNSFMMGLVSALYLGASIYIVVLQSLMLQYNEDTDDSKSNFLMTIAFTYVIYFISPWIIQKFCAKYIRPEYGVGNVKNMLLSAQTIGGILTSLLLVYDAKLNYTGLMIHDLKNQAKGDKILVQNRITLEFAVFFFMFYLEV